MIRKATPTALEKNLEQPLNTDPFEVAAQETIHFLKLWLPTPPLRILEVGCGRGHVAAGLTALGNIVTALDNSAAAVKEAATRGVTAIRADFVQFRGGPFDVVLFTRSLHHLPRLGAATERADAVLQQGGLIIAEEFAREAPDAATAGWFYDIDALLESAALSEPEHRQSRAPAKETPLKRWVREHAHEPPLLEGKAMVAALRARFEVLHMQGAPYLYRPLSARLKPSPMSGRIAAQLLGLEKEAIAQGRLRPVGLRVVLRKGMAMPPSKQSSE